MHYYLVVYDRATGTLLELKEFEDSERAQALRERFARELVERNNNEIEVVVLGAASRNALVHTHSRYFQTASELAGRTADELAEA